MKSCVPKDEGPQKLVAKIQYDHRICKVKKISLPSAGNRPVTVSSTFDEAKAANKARKRKERQESLSSQYQDTKVIRSNSEERPVSVKPADDKNNGIRRVSSSGDFPKTASEEKMKSLPKKQDQSEKTLKYDDNEHDKRRSHERFARPHTFKSRRTANKRFKVRCPTKTKFKTELQECSKRSISTTVTVPAQVAERQNQNTEQEVTSSTRFLDLHPPETERAPSPVNTPISPVLDFASLHEQVDCSEPLLSQPVYQVNENTETMPSQYIASNRLLASPRNSIIATHRIYLDPDVPQTNIPLKNPVDERIQKLSKLINSCKKKILTCEAEFEAETGAKPTQFDKLNDDSLRKLYADLSRLKKEQKQLSEMSVGGSKINLNSDIIPGRKYVTLQETINEIEKKLSLKRETAGRSINLEAMTPEELIEEKISTQKALLFLESVHGRPQSKEDRDIVRPFYDRYRVLKRMVAKISGMGTTGELETIHENEAMHFVTPTSSSNETESEKTETPTAVPINEDVKDSSIVENLHSLTKPELINQVKIVSEEKKNLRRKIKEFEMNTQAKTGRMMTKEDKKPVEDLYVSYKKVKSHLRLLEALIAKY